MSSGRSWAGAGGRYGAAGESAAWRVVFENYYWDRLDEAHEGALALGAGTMGHGLVGYRMIEGEHMTRQSSETWQADDWLHIEAIANENPLGQERLTNDVRTACDAVARRFGYEHSSPTLVSVLAHDANVPWMPGRHGYCTDKYPYEKVCVPQRALNDYDELQHVIVHEYAHVINLNLSQGKCPLWLDEAVAMVAEGGVDRRAWSMMANGGAPWLEPHRHNAAFLKNREDPAGHQQVWFAYQQSAVIGHFLVSLKGESALSDLMRAFSNNSFFQDILARFKEGGLADEALAEVYRTNTDNLYRDSFQWLKRL